MIHKSHSKNEIVKIIQACDIDIPNPKKFRKIDLSKLLNEKLKQVDSIKPNEELCIFNLVDLKYYLSNVNPKKRLSIKEKNKVIMICKKIKHLSRNAFMVEVSDYNNINEAIQDAKYICEYGDIPSVRKALRDFNEYTFLEEKFEPKLSEIVKRELEHKQKLKNVSVYKCVVKKGHFVIKFD